MATTPLIVLRHGETVWNLEGRYQGHLDSPLTATGLDQARALAERLTRHPFAALYTSDLGRALDTSRIIAERTGHTLQLDPRLRERHLGVFQGLLRAEIKEKFPEEYGRFKSGDPDHVVPGGMSSRQHSDSVLECLTDLALRHCG